MSHATTIDAPMSRAAPSPADIGLWVFIGMASSLFLLFVAAYVMRMEGSDWSAIGLPPQLWLSTTCLIAGSAALQWAAFAARRGERMPAWRLLLGGGGLAFVFLLAQLWAWQELQVRLVTPHGNPAASFFYLLTAVHGLHVLGGLVAWALTARRLRAAHDVAKRALSVRLCARYWHFLLAIWLLVLSTISGLTPDVVRFICGTSAGT